LTNDKAYANILSMKHNQDPATKTPEVSVESLSQAVTNILDGYTDHGLKAYSTIRMIEASSTDGRYTYIGENTKPDSTKTLTFYAPSEGATSDLELDEYTWESNGAGVTMRGPGEQGLHGPRRLTSPEDFAEVSQKLYEAISMLPAIS
jgi:hypothetical protein